MIEKLMYLIRDADLAEKLNKYLLKRTPTRVLKEVAPSAPPPMYVEDHERVLENVETEILPDSDVFNSSNDEIQDAQEIETTQTTEATAPADLETLNSIDAEIDARIAEIDAITISTTQNTDFNVFAPTRSGESVIVHFEDQDLQTEYYTHEATVESFNTEDYNYKIKLTKEE